MQKLTSRKFWLALVPMIVGILQVSGVVGDDVDTTAWAEAAALVIPTVAYIIVEGIRDIKNL